MSIIIMILLLSLLILVHEAGHFFVARACGIKVDKFGFGLPVGPTLFKKKVGDVEILVHAFLLGGYVSFPYIYISSGNIFPDSVYSNIFIVFAIPYIFAIFVTFSLFLFVK